MNLRDMLCITAEQRPAQLAIVDGEVRLTYAQWLDTIARVANGLAQHGVSAGKSVVFSMRNSVDFATAFFATQLLGAVAVPVNFRLKPDAVRYILNDADAAALVSDNPDILEVLHGPSMLSVWATAGTSSPGITLGELFRHGDATLPSTEITDRSLSTLMYTSGTTGRPKGVPTTHGAAVAGVTSHVITSGPVAHETVRVLGAAPAYHVVGLYWVLGLSVLTGGCYFPVSQVAPDGISRLIQDEQLTHVFASPTFFEMVLKNVEPASTFETVRHLVFGSAAMHEALVRRIEAAFPRATVTHAYGTTELGLVLQTTRTDGAPDTFDYRYLHPSVGYRVRVVRPGSDPDEIAARDELGELCVDLRAEPTFDGYWKRPDEDERRIKSGWYFTRDMAYQREDGRIMISGRADDVFKSGAENIQPAEVEVVLEQHPDIAEVAVVGLPDDRWGNVVCAVIVKANERLDVDELDAWCRESALPDFMRPRRVVFVEHLERNPSGKVLRRAASERAASAFGVSVEST